MTALAPTPSLPAILQRGRSLVPGLAIAALIALAASWLAEHYRAPVMLFALLLGLAINFVRDDPRCAEGIGFASRTLLRAGVALLGARITFGQVASLGSSALLLAAASVALAIAVGWLTARVQGLPGAFGLLSGGAVGICGASAALALSSVLPDTPERNRDTALVVVLVTALSTLAMIVYPGLAASRHLTERATGVFLGGTIHDVAQVVGAGYGVSKLTGDTATVVKLFRVALLVPVVAAVGALSGRRAAGAARPPLLPLFLVAFCALVAWTSLLPPPASVTAGLGEVSRWCLVAAIAAVGAKTSLADVLKAGWRPLIPAVAATAAILLMDLGAADAGWLSVPYPAALAAGGVR